MCVAQENKDSKPVGNVKKVDDIIIDCLSKVSNAKDKDNDFNEFKVDIEKRMDSIETLLKKLVERKKRIGVKKSFFLYEVSLL